MKHHYRRFHPDNYLLTGGQIRNIVPPLNPLLAFSTISPADFSLRLVRVVQARERVIQGHRRFSAGVVVPRGAGLCIVTQKKGTCSFVGAIDQHLSFFL